MADAMPLGVRDTVNVCGLCGAQQNLLACSACHSAWYCCKDHQRKDWKRHKPQCRKKLSKSEVEHPSDKFEDNHQIDRGAKATLEKQSKQADTHRPTEETDEAEGATPFTGEGSSETYVLNSEANLLDPATEGKAFEGNMPPHGSTAATASDAYLTVLSVRFQEISLYVQECLRKYGICVFDNFLGRHKAKEILAEVKALQDRGDFKQGQLVSSASGVTQQTIRGDVITWVDGTEPNCNNIHFLMSCTDDLIKRCAGKLEPYTITERTKAMVACYPAKSGGYLRHVDNPNRDGRCITCIYYLNENWDVKVDGGMLRIYPEDQNQVAMIEPILDRIIFFWSDRRNPHEVMPTTKSRYAITVWYYDRDERRKAVKRFRSNNTSTTSSAAKRGAVPLLNGDARK